MAKALNNIIRKFLNNAGYEIVKLEKVHIFQFGGWIEKLGIKTIIDIGSNEGQFINAISRILPGRKIIGFEPIKVCYDKMVNNTRKHNVSAFNCGVSDHNGTAEINISENFESSSVLPMEELHKQLYPKSRYVGTEKIELKKLDDAVAGLSLDENVLIKIDVQGHENKVIAGGQRTIRSAAVVILEFSYEPIYEGQWLFDEMYQYFTSNGFKFAGVEDQMKSTKTGIPIYGDAIFIRKDLAHLAY